MKTLEERALKAFPPCDQESEMYRRKKRAGYIKGATEQNGIDVKIAIEAHCSFCKAHNACADRGLFYCPETEYIQKVMEGAK